MIKATASLVRQPVQPGNLQPQVIVKQDPIPDREGPHCGSVIGSDVTEGDVQVNCETLLLRVHAHVILVDVRCLSRGQLVLVLLGVMRAIASERIGHSEVFGYKGLDVERIHASLPVREGEEYSDRTKFQVRQAVAAAIGKQPTDVAAICCDEKGNRLLFIGLPGASYKAFVYNQAPTGSERLTADIMKLYGRLDQALEAAVRKGGQAAEEDDSNGYALIRDSCCQIPSIGCSPVGR